MRLFLAVPAQSLWVRLQEDMKERISMPGLRWTRQDNIHLTLYFIGNAASGSIGAISQAVRSVFRASVPFELVPDLIATAGNPELPTMLWLRFHACDAFTELNLGIHKSLLKVADNRAFTPHEPIPHVTLARFTRGVLPSQTIPLAAAFQAPLLVTGAQLWQTTHDDHGVVYKALDSFSFGS